MTSFYDDMAATATELLTEFGKTLQLRRTTPGTYDPITGTTTGDTTADLPCIGLFTTISTSYALTNEVQGGDKMAVLDASQTPQMADKLVDGDAIWTIIKITPVDPAGTPITYKLQVRK